MNSKIKENPIFRKGYLIIKKAMSIVAPEKATKMIYKISWGRELNLENPDDFNQKIQWLKLKKYYKNDVITKCADKYRVREYLKEKGCSEILNDLLGAYDYSKDIEWDKFPDKYVIKCNHGCGYNIICEGNDTFNVVERQKGLSRQDVITLLNKWLKDNYWTTYCETNYRFINKKIIVEKFIETEKDSGLNDYKIYCYYGEPKVVLVCQDRDEDLKRAWFDMDWKYLDIASRKCENYLEIKKPECLDEMVKYARILSKDFPFVRMDFYDANGKVIFGEMTFTPAGGLGHSCSPEGYKYLGDMLDLSKCK